MSFFLLAALAAAQGLTSPTAAGWETLETGDDSGVARILPASVRRSANLARATISVRMRQPRADETPMFVTRMRFDCAANTAGFEAGDSYDEAGAHTGSFEAREDQIEMNPIEPGSLDEIVQAIACTHPEG